MFSTWMVLQQLFGFYRIFTKMWSGSPVVITMKDGALGELAKVEGDIAALDQLFGRAGDGNNHLEVGIYKLKGEYMRNS